MIKAEMQAVPVTISAVLDHFPRKYTISMRSYQRCRSLMRVKAKYWQLCSFLFLERCISFLGSKNEAPSGWPHGIISVLLSRKSATLSSRFTPVRTTPIVQTASPEAQTLFIARHPFSCRSLQLHVPLIAICVQSFNSGMLLERMVSGCR